VPGADSRPDAPVIGSAEPGLTARARRGGVSRGRSPCRAWRCGTARSADFWISGDPGRPRRRRGAV